MILAKEEVPPICAVLTLAHSGQYSQLSLGADGGDLLQLKVKDHKRLKMNNLTCFIVGEVNSKFC